MRLQITTDSPQQTMAFARTLAGCLRSGDLVALRGPLGSGKTCFVRGLASGLGISENVVSSPTFIICQEYEPPKRGEGGDGNSTEPATANESTAERVGRRGGGGGLTLVHVDVYRLAEPSELESIGWEELLCAANTVIAVEWADRVASALPDERIEVSFEHVDEAHRAITIATPARMDRRLQSFAAEVHARSGGRCPICGARVEPAAETLPFCSDRCRLVDLGRWFNEDYNVARPVGEGDLD
jgi:tRNA threonylcarbamoyladenosine biosynthesis protein TsaE